MIEQLILTPKGRGRVERRQLYGLPVLRAEVDREGFWGDRRLRRAGKNLRMGGALSVLVPGGFVWWAALERFGLRPMDPEAFVRAQATPLALKALERLGLAPDRATVALRGGRTDQDMIRTAAQLCPRVRHLVVDAPRGGAELAAWLRREFGVPILPEGETGQVAIHFQGGCPHREGSSLELYGAHPQLSGMTLTAPGLAEEDQKELPLLAALWEGGRLKREDIKIT